MTRETPYLREPGYALRYRDRRFQERSGPATHRRECAAIRRLLTRVPAADGRWLDAPSGAGRLSALLPGPVVRVDRDLEMLRAAGSGPRAQATLARLPFADASFAGALCMRLLQHVPGHDERRAMLAELARVTRGPLLVSFFDRQSLQHLRRRLRARFGGRASARVAIAAGELREDLAACGRRIVAIESLRRWISEQRIVLALPG